MRPFYYEFSRQGLLLSLISLERTEQFLAYQKEEPIFWFEKIISLRVKLAENNSVNFKAKNDSQKGPFAMTSDKALLLWNPMKPFC